MSEAFRLGKRVLGPCHLDRPPGLDRAAGGHQLRRFRRHFLGQHRLGRIQHQRTRRPPGFAIYTSAFKQDSSHYGHQAQSLAWSTDGGYTWTKNHANPVLDRQSANFRDPKVFRSSGPAGSYWVMVAVEAREHKVVLYRSDDLKTWEDLSSFGPVNGTGGVWECPDLFPLPVDGNEDNIKWVLTVNLNPGGPNGGSAGQYFVGHFDGVRFSSATTVTEGLQDPARLSEYLWLDWGRDYCAAVSLTTSRTNAGSCSGG